MRYEVEIEALSKDPAIAGNSVAPTICRAVFACTQAAVDFARKGIAEYAGDYLPRAHVRAHYEKGRRKSQSDAVFSVWRKPNGEIVERRFTLSPKEPK